MDRLTGIHAVREALEAGRAFDRIVIARGRQDTRVYAKPVQGGTSDHNLSEEEERAIRLAMERPRETVEAR